MAFAEEEQKLKIEQKCAEVLCLEQESKLETLKLKRELAENQARLNVCMKSEESNFEECLDELPPENKEEDINKFFSSQSLIKLNEHELTEGITSTQTVKDVSFSPVSVGDMFQAYLKDLNLNPASKSVRESYLTPYAKPFTPKDTVTGGIMSVVTPHPEVNPPVSNYLQEPQEKKSDSGWEKIACSLERCIDKLVESNTKLVAASIEQNELLIRALQYPVNCQRFKFQFLVGIHCILQFGKQLSLL